MVVVDEDVTQVEDDGFHNVCSFSESFWRFLRIGLYVSLPALQLRVVQSGGISTHKADS